MPTSGERIHASDIPVREAQQYQDLTTTGADSTLTTAYSSRSGVVTPTITKRGGAETNLRVDLSVSGFQITLLTVVTFGVTDGTTDYPVCKFFPTALSTRAVTSGSALLTGLAAGNYTVQLRHKASSGTTCVFRQVNSDDFTDLMVMEVDT